MNYRYDQALAQAGENKEALTNVLEQASDLGSQTKSLLWQYLFSISQLKMVEMETTKRSCSCH